MTTAAAAAAACELQVAACVCLFSLDKHEAIPVDTHVWALACRYCEQGAEGVLPGGRAAGLEEGWGDSSASNTDSSATLTVA